MKTPITGNYKPDRATKAHHVYCPDRKAEIPECQCLACPMFKVWHKRDVSRCYYEYLDLKSKGYYLRIRIPRPRIKTPGPCRRGGKRIDLSGPGISGENHTANNAESQRNELAAETKEWAQHQQGEQMLPQEPEIENKGLELQKKGKQAQSQELDINNQWSIIWDDISPLEPLGTHDTDNIDLDQNLQNPLSPLDNFDLDPGPIN